MSVPRTPLDLSLLGLDAQRALGSPATRMLAARGLVPVNRPRDLLGLLYQLGFDKDDRLKEAALESVRKLPDGVLRGGLSDPGIDPRVLDKKIDPRPPARGDAGLRSGRRQRDRIA